MSEQEHDWCELSEEEILAFRSTYSRQPFDESFELDFALSAYRSHLLDQDRAHAFIGWPASYRFIPGMGRQEAQFWFLAATQLERLGDSDDERLSSIDLIQSRMAGPPLTTDEARDRLAQIVPAGDARLSAIYPQLPRVLEAMFGTTQSIVLTHELFPDPIFCFLSQNFGYPDPQDPLLTEPRNRVYTLLNSLTLTDDNDIRLYTCILARFPDPARIPPLLDIVFDRLWLADSEDLSRLIFSIESPAEHMKRVSQLYANTRGTLNNPRQHLWKLFQQEGYASLPEQLEVPFPKRTYQWLLESFWAKFHTRHLVRPIFALLTKKDLASFAETWLLKEGENAIVELFKLATNTGQKREFAKKLLLSYVERGDATKVRKLWLSQPVQIQKALTFLNFHKDEQDSQEMTQIAPISWPSWVDQVAVNSVPPAWFSAIAPWWSLDKRPIPPHVEQALRSLLATGVTVKAGDFEYGSVHVDERLRTLAHLLDPERAQQVTRQLVEVYVREGWVESNQWALNALAVFVSDAAIFDLAKELVGRTSRHQKHNIRLNALRLLGSIDHPEAKAAMIRLDHSNITDIREEVARWRKQRAANAQQHETLFSLSHISHCGLDDLGRASFVVGADTYTASLVDIDTFELVDPQGHPIANLPSRKTDTNAIQQERERLKQIRLQLEIVTRDLWERFTQTQIYGWTIPDWRTIILKHPLLFQTARAFLWRVLTGERKDLVLRLCEDKTFADINDEIVPLELLADDVVYFARQNEIPPTDLVRWREILTSYKQVRALAQISE